MKMLFSMNNTSEGVDVDADANPNPSSASPESHANVANDGSNHHHNNNNNNSNNHNSHNNHRSTNLGEKPKAKKKIKKGGATLKQDVAALLSFEFNPDRKGGITGHGTKGDDDTPLTPCRHTRNSL